MIVVHLAPFCFKQLSKAFLGIKLRPALDSNQKSSTLVVRMLAPKKKFVTDFNLLFPNGDLIPLRSYNRSYR